MPCSTLPELVCYLQVVHTGWATPLSAYVDNQTNRTVTLKKPPARAACSADSLATSACPAVPRRPSSMVSSAGRPASIVLNGAASPTPVASNGADVDYDIDQIGLDFEVAEDYLPPPGSDKLAISIGEIVKVFSLNDLP